MEPSSGGTSRSGFGPTPIQKLRPQRKSPGRYGEPLLVKPRIGQGAFRVLVTDAYQRRCAITGEHTLPMLEAAHILPFSEKRPNLVSNGLLLRADFHELFDLGLVTVTPELRVEVSPPNPRRMVQRQSLLSASRLYPCKRSGKRHDEA